MSGAAEVERVCQRSFWWASFVIVLGIIETWSLAMPPFAAPDEPAHVIKAVASVHGDLLGEPTGTSTIRSMRVPKEYATSGAVPGCFAFKAAQDASCAPDFDGLTGNQVVNTPAGAYPPLYYVLVGIPSLFVSGEASLYMMRFFSAMITAAFLASALSASAMLKRPMPAVLAVVATATPMTLFVGGSVNPSAMEIAAGIAVWSSGLTLLCNPKHPQIRRAMWRFTIASCALILSRLLSPGVYVLIVLFLLGSCSLPAVKQIASLPGAKRCGATIGLSLVGAMLWVVGFNGMLGHRSELARSSVGLVREVLGRQDFNFRQMIGIFGWLDTPSPALTYNIWIGVIGLFVFLSIALGASRARWMVLSSGLASVCVPWALEVKEATAIGIFWQGRYTMPFAVGVLIMAGFALAESEACEFFGRRLTNTVLCALAVGILVAYLQYSRRFAVGMGGPLLFFFGSPRWDPFVLSWALLIPVAVVLIISAGLALTRLQASLER